MGKHHDNKTPAIEKKNYHLNVIIVIVSVATFLVLLYTVILPILHDNFAIEDIDKTYKNHPLNFQITKPNQDWSFDENMTSVISATGQKPPTTILGGVVVQNPDKQGILVFVISKNDPYVNDLTNYAKMEMEQFKIIYPNASYHISTSFDGNSVLIDATDDPNNIRFAIHDKLQIHGDKIYTIMESFRHDQTLTEQTITELNETFNSFGYIN